MSKTAKPKANLAPTKRKPPKPRLAAMTADEYGAALKVRMWTVAEAAYFIAGFTPPKMASFPIVQEAGEPVGGLYRALKDSNIGPGPLLQHYAGAGQWIGNDRLVPADCVQWIVDNTPYALPPPLEAFRLECAARKKKPKAVADAPTIKRAAFIAEYGTFIKGADNPENTPGKHRRLKDFFDGKTRKAGETAEAARFRAGRGEFKLEPMLEYFKSLHEYSEVGGWE